MKKILFFITAVLLTLAFPACSPPAGPGQSPPPSPTVSVSPAVSLPAPSPTIAVSHSPSASDSAYKQPTEDTVIIANSEGYIIGCYSDGKWLTYFEAAAYCRQPMEFYRHEISETVQSSGVNTENGGYRLDIPDSYSPYYLFYANPERFPKTGEVKNGAEVKRAVQKRLDDHYGTGKAKAIIIEDISADIDNDGKSEIVFNSNTIDEESSFNGVDSYSMAGVIEEDGSMHLTAEYYNAIDIDGDGICEFVAELSDFETDTFNVYKYDGKEFTQVLGYERNSL